MAFVIDDILWAALMAAAKAGAMAGKTAVTVGKGAMAAGKAVGAGALEAGKLAGKGITTLGKGVAKGVGKGAEVLKGGETGNLVGGIQKLGEQGLESNMGGLFDALKQSLGKSMGAQTPGRQFADTGIVNSIRGALQMPTMSQLPPQQPSMPSIPQNIMGNLSVQGPAGGPQGATMLAGQGEAMPGYGNVIPQSIWNRIQSGQDGGQPPQQNQFLKNISRGLGMGRGKEGKMGIPESFMRGVIGMPIGGEKAGWEAYVGTLVPDFVRAQLKMPSSAEAMAQQQQMAYREASLEGKGKPNATTLLKMAQTEAYRQMGGGIFGQARMATNPKFKQDYLDLVNKLYQQYLTQFGIGGTTGIGEENVDTEETTDFGDLTW